MRIDEQQGSVDMKQEFHELQLPLRRDHSAQQQFVISGRVTITLQGVVNLSNLKSEFHHHVSFKTGLEDAALLKFYAIWYLGVHAK